MSNIEVEIKRKIDISQDELRERLLASKFYEAGTSVEVDTYYSRPDVDFMETVECLRIREKGDFCEITYKPPTSSSNSRNGVISKKETNVRLCDVSEAVVAKELLANLDMKLLVEVNKQRISYRREGDHELTVAIDTIKDAGTFIEVEVVSQDTGQAKRTLKAVEAELGVSDMELVTLPYRDIVMRAI